MFCIVHLFYALPCVMLIHFCVKFILHVILFNLCEHFALLENALPWAHNQSLLHVCVVYLLSWHIVVSSSVVWLSVVGQHLATYFAE